MFDYIRYIQTGDNADRMIKWAAYVGIAAMGISTTVMGIAIFLRHIQ